MAATLEIDHEDLFESLPALIDPEQVGDAKEVWHELAELASKLDGSDGDRLLGLLAIQWFNEEGFAALDEIRAQQDLPYDVWEEVLWRVLSHAIQESPKLAVEYLLALPKRPHKLVSDLMRQWARTDISSALDFASTVPQGDLRMLLQAGVAEQWARQDPRNLLEDLSVLPESVRYGAARIGVETIARYSLQEAGMLAMQIGDPHLRFDAVRWLLPNEPKTLLDWLLGDSAVYEFIVDDIRLRERLVYKLVDIDPRLAFALATEQPIAEWGPGVKDMMEQYYLRIPGSTSGIGLEAQIMRYIAANDIELALQLLPDIREGETKWVGTLQVGNPLIYQGDFMSAFNLASQLPVSSHEDYFAGIINTWRILDPIGLLESINQFPSAELRSRVAYYLLRWDRRHCILKTSQVETLEQLLNRVDRDFLQY